MPHTCFVKFKLSCTVYYCIAMSVRVFFINLFTLLTYVDLFIVH